jgi:transposase
VSSRAAKLRALKQARALNFRPEQVRAELFHTHAFFDREDKAQVKYEMLRRRELEEAPVVETCREFGFTRESYRHLVERFRMEGMGALFEKKRGRQRPLKVSETVRKWIREQHQEHSEFNADELAERLEQQSGIRLSRRTIYRVLADMEEQKKKRRRKRTRG